MNVYFRCDVCVCHMCVRGRERGGGMGTGCQLGEESGASLTVHQCRCLSCVIADGVGTDSFFKELLHRGQVTLTTDYTGPNVRGQESETNV